MIADYDIMQKLFTRAALDSHLLKTQTIKDDLAINQINRTNLEIKMRVSNNNSNKDVDVTTGKYK